MCPRFTKAVIDPVSPSLLLSDFLYFRYLHVEKKFYNKFLVKGLADYPQDNPVQDGIFSKLKLAHWLYRLKYVDYPLLQFVPITGKNMHEINKVDNI